ncbi:LAETG motif-containing sortase-dependent surface protein [Streptomyces atriruber]|uniref:LAETG motif-containing sortase-dependent surface protein n=1 Tax=Streptomyces atriruber TaxID=545121 RepID=UPI00099EEA6A|nr:LAETG motif-containing sortase-dependent surface protein [Streptomyces atriruber]
MKLRRAMAAAAAAAVIAPIALLSAPAASATEDTPTPPAPSSGTPTAPVTPTPPVTPPVTPPAETPETPGTPKPADKPTRPSVPPASGKDLEDELPPVPDEDAEDEPDTCPSDDGDTDADSVLEVDLIGLPKKIVAGSGWHRFKLSAANPTDEPLGEVDWTAFVNNLGADPEEKDGLRYFTEVQFLDPETDEWTSVDSPLGDGLAYGTVDLDAEDKAVIKLRAKVGAKAPAMDGYAVGLGTYVDSELDCTHTSSEYLPLTIVKAGSGDDATPTATPKPSPSKTKQADSEPKPQGSAEETPAPVTGNLAETGSSSMLPTVGVIGGIAVVAGAGVVFAVRRRKADGTV